MHTGEVRRSTVVTLTLLPMLASAAVARADDRPTAAPANPPTAAPASSPTFPLPPDAEPDQLMPPGMMQQVLMPPGMTPPADCENDPDWTSRPECQPQDAFYYSEDGGVIRGGFGSYFWVGGG